MGSFQGHVLIGSFFLIYSFWWSFNAAMRYIKCRNQDSIGSRQRIKKYITSSTWPCICLPNRLQKYPLESISKVVLLTLGMIGEIIMGIHKSEIPTSNTSTEPTILQHHHKRDGESSSTSSWYFSGHNAQHLTMYAAFLIGAVVEILVHNRVHLPLRIEFLCGIFSFGIEALLFQFHLHGRDEIDTHVHILLIIATYACVFSCILEYINPQNVLFTYARILFTMLQGTWLWQIAFVVFPPFKSLENRWDSTNHMHIMFLTMSYIWHFLLIFIALLTQFLILNHLYGSSSSSSSTKYSMIDDEEIKCERFMISNDSQTITNNNNDDDDDFL